MGTEDINLFSFFLYTPSLVNHVTFYEPCEFIKVHAFL